MLPKQTDLYEKQNKNCPKGRMPHTYNKSGYRGNVSADHPAKQSPLTEILMKEPVKEHKVKFMKSFKNSIADTLSVPPGF